MKILIAGVAGASLGTELLKCLQGHPQYEIYTADISHLAFGLYSRSVKGAFVADRTDYVRSIVNFCTSMGIQYVVPGGEQPSTILAASLPQLESASLKLVANDPSVVRIFSDKATTFDFLRAQGFPIPATYGPDHPFPDLPYPCIIKPSTDSGGSASVFLATNPAECRLYAELITATGRKPVIQEYVPLDEGEFTIGVLSNPKGEVLGSVAMKRIFNSKLSIGQRTAAGLISTGYSQGLIDDFPEIRRQAEAIAVAARSKGPLNIQGRLRNGILLPFEVNPRFSASTYLRAMAGFNELIHFLQSLEGTSNLPMPVLIPGYYLRSFTEQHIPLDRQLA